MTTNIEPTEEQRRAVGKLFYELDAHLHGHDIERVARLLAEREHKLREENDDLRADVRTLFYDLRDQLQADLDAARARIAELEKALGSRIVSEGELGLLLEASEQREATHLAHIKALRGHVQAAYDRGVEDAHNRGLDIGVTDLLADTAHYDVEGEEEK